MKSPVAAVRSHAGIGFAGAGMVRRTRRSSSSTMGRISAGSLRHESVTDRETGDATHQSGMRPPIDAGQSNAVEGEWNEAEEAAEYRQIKGEQSPAPA